MKILFLPTYDYLSIKIMINISKKFNDDETFFLNHDEFNEPINEDHLKNFNHVITMINKTTFYSTLINRWIVQFCFNKKRRWSIKNIVKSINPDVVVGLSDSSVVFSSVYDSLKNSGTKFYLIQPSFFDLPTKISFRQRARQFIFNILVAKKYSYSGLWGADYPDVTLFLWGDIFVRIFNGYKNPIVVAGNPSYSNEINHQRFNINNKNRSIRQDVIICTESLRGIMSEEDIKIVYNFYSDLISSNPGVSFLIYLHPRDNYLDISRFINPSTKNYKIINNGNLFDELFGSRIQISLASTTSLESPLFYTSPILVDPPTKFKLVNFLTAYFEHKADSPFLTSCLIDDLLRKDLSYSINFKNNIIENFFGGDLHNSSNKIYKYIKSENERNYKNPCNKISGTL